MCSLASSFSVGATPYLKQGTISLVSCGCSMLITILSSIKLYLNINDNLQSESDMARKLYVLS
jgi:cell division protein FtsW (lipid II flippase)